MITTKVPIPTGILIELGNNKWITVRYYDESNLLPLMLHWCNNKDMISYEKIFNINDIRFEYLFYALRNKTSYFVDERTNHINQKFDKGINTKSHKEEKEILEKLMNQYGRECLALHNETRGNYLKNCI